MGKNKIDFNKKRNLGDILSDGIKFFLSNFASIGRQALLYGLPIIVILLIFYFFFDFNPFTDPDWVEDIGWDSLFSITTYSIANILITLLVGSSVLSFVKVYLDKDEKPTDAEVFSQMKKLVPAFILIGLIWIAILSLAIFIIAIPFILELFILGIILVPLGFVASCYLLVPLYLSYPILTFRTSDAIEAFKYSFELIKGQWWFSFGTIFIVFLIVSVASYILVLPVTVLSFMEMISSEDGPGNYLMYQKIQYLIGSVGNILSLMFYIPCICLLYFTLVERKEHISLKEKIRDVFENEKEEDDLF